MSREGMPALLVESHAFIPKGWGGVSAQPGEGNLHFPHIFMLFTFRIYSWHRAIITDGPVFLRTQYRVDGSHLKSRLCDFITTSRPRLLHGAVGFAFLRSGKEPRPRLGTVFCSFRVFSRVYSRVNDRTVRKVRPNWSSEAVRR
jgi:hypothetical protein